jgi:hydroxyethylthiazole kinase-like uncharacterized protein yjeF
MQAADRRTIDEIAASSEISSTGWSASFILMRRVGEAIGREICAEIRRHRGGLDGTSDGPVVVLVGPGNNGGDGLVIARVLREEGLSIQVVLVGGSQRSTVWRESAAELFEGSWWKADSKSGRGGCFVVGEIPQDRWGIEFGEREPTELDDAELDRVISGASVLVDALLGTGQRGAPQGSINRMVAAVERWQRGERGGLKESDGVSTGGCPRRVIAVDLPTGVCAESGRVFDQWIVADLTLTVQGIKRGCLLAPAFHVCGELRVIEGGIQGEREPQGMGMTARKSVRRGAIPSCVIPCAPNVHKFQRGRVVVVGGEREMPGAPALVSEAAQRVGAGLVVQCRTTEIDQSWIRPEVLRVVVGKGACFASVHGERVVTAIAGAHAVVVGPGLGRAAETRFFLGELLGYLAEHRRELPVVIDADGLTLIASSGGALAFPSREKKWILTPHHGEAARLLGVDSAHIEAEPVDSARALATRYGCTIVLKGAGTVIADSERYWLIPPGPASLATAGSGDVLAGIIGGLCAQARAREERLGGASPTWGIIAAEGVLIHTEAGYYASGQRGGEGGDESRSARGLVAHEVARAISEVVAPVIAPRYCVS